MAVADLLSFEQEDSENSTPLPLVILALFDGSKHYGLLFNKNSQFFQGGGARPKASDRRQYVKYKTE